MRQTPNVGLNIRKKWREWKSEFTRPMGMYDGVRLGHPAPHLQSILMDCIFKIFARGPCGLVRVCLLCFWSAFTCVLEGPVFECFEGLCSRVGACVKVYLSGTARRGDPTFAGK